MKRYLIRDNAGQYVADFTSRRPVCLVEMYEEKKKGAALLLQVSDFDFTDVHVGLYEFPCKPRRWWQVWRWK